MKDRFISLLGGLAALYVFVALFFNPQVSDLAQLSVPTSVDQGTLGLKGLHDWLEKSDVPVYRLRGRYRDLDNIRDLGKRGNLMILSLPQVAPARKREIDFLQKWVKQGNHLLILAARSDGHLLQAKFNSSGSRLLQRFGFRLTPKATDIKDEKKKTGIKEALNNTEPSEAITLQPRGRHPLTRDISQISTKGNKLSPQLYTLVSSSSYRSSMVLLENRDKVPAFWETRYGHSRVWVSRFAYLFSNGQLGEKDNARLLANIVSAAVAPGGKVVFDDMHQGNTELYDKKALFSDPRLHNTLWFIFAFWVLYVIGHTNRIAPLVSRNGPSKASDFVRAMANLFARRLTPVAAANLLFSHFFDWIRIKYSLPTNGQPVWQLLESTERIDKNDLAELQQRYAELQKNKKVNLMKLVNKMQKMRSALS